MALASHLLLELDKFAYALPLKRLPLAHDARFYLYRRLLYSDALGQYMA